MTLPIMAAIISFSIYSIVDAIFLGIAIGPVGVGVIGLTFPVMIGISSAGFLVGSGGTAVISRFLGERNEEQASRAIAMSFLLTILMSTLIVVVLFPFLDFLIDILGASGDEFSGHSKDYLTYLILGSIALMSLEVTSGILMAHGQSGRSNILFVLASIINIILDAIFIFIFGWGVAGAAIATVLSNLIVLGLGFHFLKDSTRISQVRLEYFLQIRGSLLLQIFRLGIPQFFQDFGFAIVMAVINNLILVYGANHSDTYIIAFSIVNRIGIILVTPMLGIAWGVLPIIGYNYGAKNQVRVLATLKTAIIVSASITTIIVLISIGISHIGLQQILNDEMLANYTLEILTVLYLGLPFVGITHIITSYFQAIGKSRRAIFIMLAKQIFIPISSLLIAGSLYGIKGLWVAFPLADLISLFPALALLLIQLKRESIAD